MNYNNMLKRTQTMNLSSIKNVKKELSILNYTDKIMQYKETFNFYFDNVINNVVNKPKFEKVYRNIHVIG